MPSYIIYIFCLFLIVFFFSIYVFLLAWKLLSISSSKPGFYEFNTFILFSEEV